MKADAKAVATPVVCDVCGRERWRVGQPWSAIEGVECWAAMDGIQSSGEKYSLACYRLGYGRAKKKLAEEMLISEGVAKRADRRVAELKDEVTGHAAQAADALKRLDEMEVAETLARRAYCRMWSPRHPMTVPEMMADAVAMFETAAHPELANLAQQRYADRTAQWEAEVRRRVDAEDRAEALAGERDALRGLLAGWLTPRLHDRHAPDAGYGDRCKTGCPGCSKTAEIYIRTNCALAKPPAGQAPPPAPGK